MKKILCVYVAVFGLLLQTFTSHAQSVLCSFESEGDLTGIVATPSVKFRRSPLYAALNAHSLECIFPGTGGTVNINRFGVPSWTDALGGDNAGADALLLFVWAVDTDEIVIQVKDSLSVTAKKSFMLRRGANHLQYRFADLTALNTDKISSLSIECRTAADLFVDYIALDRYQQVLENGGRWDVKYSDSVKTEHFPWGSRLANGTIKTYSISPVFDGRGIVELSERLDIDHKVTTVGRDPAINRWGFGDFYNRRNPMGDDGAHPFSLAHNYISDDFLYDSLYDVIIWPGLHPWQSYPENIRSLIRRRVEAGTGLLLLYPDGKGIDDFSQLSPLLPHPNLNIDSLNKLSRHNRDLWLLADTSAWAKNGDHFITRGLETAQFPFGSIGVLPFKANNGTVIMQSANGNPVIAVKNYGKGRVVAMAYLENGFIPNVKNPWGTGKNNKYWEQMWSMVSRAVVWAAKKESKTIISSASFDKSALKVQVENAQAGDSLLVFVEDSFGEKEITSAIALKSGKSDLNIRVGGQLHGGAHAATFQLAGKKGIYDWYTVSFASDQPAKIISITNLKAEIPAGQPLQTTVKLSSGKNFFGKLIGRLYDNYNRLAAVQEVALDFIGEKNYSFSFDSKNVITHLGRVDFVLSDSNRQQDRKQQTVFFLRPRVWNDYDVTLYHFGPNPVPGTWDATDGQLQKMNVTTLAAYTLEQSMNANYKVQAQTRISGMESPDSGPDLEYYDSIKKVYLETRNKKVLVRKYGLNDSTFLHSVKKELDSMVPVWRKFSPSAYYIYEEPSVTRYDDALDLDFSDISMVAMRKWLQSQYSSLATLNAQWGTTFKQWDDVIPDDALEARKRGNFSSWADHRSFMENSWAGQFKYVQDALHEIDPGGLVQLSGTQASGAHNGYDYSQINKYVGQMNPYDIGNQLEYHHDFNPDLKISGQAGYGASGKSVLYDYYQHLFVNETGGAYIFWQQSALNPDLSLCQSGKDMQSGFGEMREKGVGKLIASFQPENENRIAIHYSYPSIHAAWIADGEIKPGRTYGNTSATLEQFRRNLDGWVKILQDGGLGFDFISYGAIETGDLIKKGYKVLVLPMSMALSDEEVKQIKLFVKNGGTLITDALAGIMDGHTKFRKESALADALGVKAAQYSLKEIVTPATDKLFSPNGAVSLTGGKKANSLLYHSYGAGSAYMLNYFLDAYPSLKLKNENGVQLSRIRTVFEKAGITPVITLTDDKGVALTGISKYSFSENTSGGALLGMLPDKLIPFKSIRINIGSTKHVYDIRNSKYIGNVNQVLLPVEAAVPSLLALLPGKIDGLRMKVPSHVSAGDNVQLSYEALVSDSMMLRSVVSISVFDPHGNKMGYYSSNSDIIANKGIYSFRTALNDEPGKWRVEMREAISGKIAAADFIIGGKSPKLLPLPQQSMLSKKEFEIDNKWTLITNGNDKLQAVKSFKEQLLLLNNVRLKENTRQSGKTVQFIVKQNAVQIGETVDTNKTALARQAYRLELNSNSIKVIANAPQGLYYGVQTLLQLLQNNEMGFRLPEGVITDWPNLNIRMIYWDDAHHLEKFEVLKREIKQASAYKINAFAIKLEGHFQYKIAAPIVEPHALSPKQYQELTDYAAAHFVQLVPYLDAPAHVSFILKHPEFKELRAFPNSNYQFTVNNPKTYKLLGGMFKELIDANKGSEYVLLSNDEAYYIGKAANEIDSAKALGGNGKLLAQFLGRMADSLKQHGRKVLFWGEYPLKPEDIGKLPKHLINGVYDSSWAPLFKQRGIRQFIYTSTQGEEPLFPNYYPLSGEDVLHEENASLNARVPGLLTTITDAIEQRRSDLGGVIVAGWADAGLHPQSFWLGYATGAAMGWNHKASADQMSRNFFTTFYKSSDPAIERVYELASRQAQFYEDSWEWGPSNARTGIFGNHAEIYPDAKPALDQFLMNLPIPDAKNLSVPFNWSDSNARRIQLAKRFLRESDELVQLLDALKVKSNTYNLEVIKSIAGITRMSLNMILHLDRINNLLHEASASAQTDRRHALALVDEAIHLSEVIKTERKNALQSLETTWYKDWLPLVTEANGRKYLHAVDDVKDHRPIRTTDLSYLVYREKRYPLGEWLTAVKKVRDEFARQR